MYFSSGTNDQTTLSQDLFMFSVLLYSQAGKIGFYSTPLSFASETDLSFFLRITHVLITIYLIQENLVIQYLVL